MQTPGLIVILYESPNSPHRVVFTDGRPLPKDPNPTWLGYSVGRWEQDALVVESQEPDSADPSGRTTAILASEYRRVATVDGVPVLAPR